MAIDYTGAGGGFRTSLDGLEQAVYNSAAADRIREERVTRNRLQKRIERDEETKRLARAIERDHQNRERMKQTKAEEKRRCIAAGMTASDFEATYWPTRKLEIIRERIDAQAKAQATDGMYHNVL